MKVSTGLAGGALVFSIGLLPNAETLVASQRLVVAATWVCLFMATVFGIFAHASLPIMMKNRNYSLEYKPFTIPARFHQILFLLGVMGIASTLVLLLFRVPDFAVTSKASDAVRVTISAIPIGCRIGRIETIELLRGTDPNDLNSAFWHIRLDVSQRSGSSKTCGARATGNVYDSLVNVGTGLVNIVQL